MLWGKGVKIQVLGNCRKPLFLLPGPQRRAHQVNKCRSLRQDLPPRAPLTDRRVGLLNCIQEFKVSPEGQMQQPPQGFYSGELTAPPSPSPHPAHRLRKAALRVLGREGGRGVLYLSSAPKARATFPPSHHTQVHPLTQQEPHLGAVHSGHTKSAYLHSPQPPQSYLHGPILSYYHKLL